MVAAPTLKAKERELLALTARAVFANPFGDEREKLDRRIGGAPDHESAEESQERAVGRVRSLVEAMARRGAADARLHRGEHAEAVRLAFLFDVFHSLLKDLDGHILEQESAGDEPCRVPFARAALERLAARGFEPGESLRYFAFFYQLRRAFHFINGSLVGRSPSMRRLRCHLWNNVFTTDAVLFERFLWDRMEDFATLLLGETGTGKGAAAAAVGRSGFIPFDAARGAFAESFTRNFISINLSRYPEGLIESELFGHRKGAFTGAVSSHQGVFARCRPHGAIFLDEIGDVSVPVQTKLLQVLQERTFSPVGGHEKQRFEGRVIAATNQSLGNLRRQGRFRDDFFYRLCSDVVVVPPLRQRLAEDAGELDLLLRHLLTRLAGPGARPLFDRVRGALERSPGREYAWPGNVRELEQAVRRVLLTGRYAGDRTEPSAGPEERLKRAATDGDLTARGLVEWYCRLLYERLGTYEAVARRTGLDRRTVKRHVEAAGKDAGNP